MALRRTSNIGLMVSLVAMLFSSHATAEPAAAAPQPVGLLAEVASDVPTSALAGTVFSRILSPLALESVRRKLGGVSARVEMLFPLDGERFTLFVPKRVPADGYGLLVFIRPSEDAAVPAGWASVLERLGIIYITAARAGNRTNVSTRRMPLALAAYEYAVRHYPVDRSRTYVGGFSGGSRVSIRLALAYPDLFRGAILNAGSDPIGEASIALPDKDRLSAFRSSRLVFVTGTSDEASMALDHSTLNSLRHWCVSNFMIANIDLGGHEIAGPEHFDKAIGDLTKRAAAPAPVGCEAKRKREIDTALTRVQAKLDKGDGAAARKLIVELDGTYGGLVGEALIKLADQCACGILPSSVDAPPYRLRN